MIWFDEFCFCGLSTYVRGLELPPRDDGRRTLVEFEGVGHAPTLMAADQVAAVTDFLLATEGALAG